MLHEPNQRDRLESLPESHLVGQDTVNTILVETNHPVETTNLNIMGELKLRGENLLGPNLVISHDSTFNVTWALVELDQITLGSVEVREKLLVLLLLSLPVPAVSLHLPLRGLLLPPSLGLRFNVLISATTNNVNKPSVGSWTCSP